MNIVSRKSAKESGLPRYFTGVECVNGHIAERNTPDGKCRGCAVMRDKLRAAEKAKYQRTRRAAATPEQKAKALEYKRDKYAENPEREREKQRAKRANSADQIRATARAYKIANREKINAYQREQRAKNIEKHKARDIARANANRDANNDYHRLHYAQNRPAILDRKKRYYALNPEIVAGNRFKRRARKAMALPSWFDELDQFVWQEAAHLARLRRDATGIEWAADHMIPLAAKNACGLHVGTNCQVIPAYLNLHKGNKLIMTEPFDWISYL